MRTWMLVVALAAMAQVVGIAEEITSASPRPLGGEGRVRGFRNTKVISRSVLTDPVFPPIHIIFRIGRHAKSFGFVLPLADA